MKLINEIKDFDKIEQNLKDIKDYFKANLKLTENQLNNINTQLYNIFKENYKKELYAVRSSSSEEDLKEASFDGQYETKLGVPFEKLEKNIVEVFLSVFNFRVLKYKIEKKLDYLDFNIAIIIMRQVKYDKAGVAFSLNINNNDYDEAIINSNFWLGETVVEGIVTSDCFIINKVSKNIIDKKLGKKQIKIMIEINDEKNLNIKKYSNNENKNTFSLNDEEIFLILSELISIENSY